MYDLCSTAVVDTSALLPGRGKRVISASLDFFNEQSKSYIASLERKLALESEPVDARSFSERLMAVIGRHPTSSSAGPHLDISS
ncbi:hypothetical protein [Rhodanobacter sp. K2T2]|uniref:hypothetical protein n=1 Tax=Rhodanobacter sp. K2T2 TaxID=2723085 RepID=UPI001C534C7B|nr:hypothetical protein [Rhodanobacter sp. K2T2]